MEIEVSSGSDDWDIAGAKAVLDDANADRNAVSRNIVHPGSLVANPINPSGCGPRSGLDQVQASIHRSRTSPSGTSFSAITQHEGRLYLARRTSCIALDDPYASTAKESYGWKSRSKAEANG